jgi:DNA topoisomerase-1
MVVRRSRFGPFLSCGGFPNCKQTVRLKGDALKQAEEQLGPAPARPKSEPTDIDCDACGAKMVIRSGRAGRFLGCSAYPKCKNTKPLGSEPARTEGS